MKDTSTVNAGLEAGNATILVVRNGQQIRVPVADVLASDQIIYEEAVISTGGMTADQAALMDPEIMEPVTMEVPQEGFFGGLGFLPVALGAAGLGGATLIAANGDDGDDGDTIIVQPDNVAPVAINDGPFETRSNEAITVDVLNNDFDFDGDDLEIVSVSDPENGTAEIVIDEDGNQVVQYTPDADFEGEDDFTYTVSDGNGNTDTGRATVVVDGGEAPEAEDDQAEVFSGQAVEIDVLANDSDADGDDFSITAASDPSNGTIEVITDDEGNQTFEYTANEGFEGTDSFQYEITDETGKTSIATVNVDVTRDPSEPVDPGLTDFLLADGGILGGLTGNDGVLGDITGSDSTLGDLIGSNSTLGVLTGPEGEGIIGDLTGLTTLGDGTGNDGILDPLIADDGALGDLTGNNGALGALTGSEGIVGELIVDSGVLGEVTGQEGVIGDLTGRPTLESDNPGAGSGNDLLGGLLGGEGNDLLGGLPLLGDNENGDLLGGLLGGEGGDNLLSGLPILGGGENSDLLGNLPILGGSENGDLLSGLPLLGDSENGDLLSGLPIIGDSENGDLLGGLPLLGNNENGDLLGGLLGGENGGDPLSIVTDLLGNEEGGDLLSGLPLLGDSENGDLLGGLLGGEDGGDLLGGLLGGEDGGLLGGLTDLGGQDEAIAA